MSKFTRRSIVVALSTAFVLPLLAQAQDRPAIIMPKAKVKARIGLEGYCPVCITDMRKWMKGSADHKAVYDGVTYYFPGDGPKQKFLKNPAKYVPALGGDCIACYAMAKKRVPGNIRFASSHKGRLYLFPGDKEKQVFMKNPAKFENTDLAYQGDCSVCKVMANKQVPGKTQFTAIHDGFRYLFPSDRERQMFANNPAKFADKTLTMKNTQSTAMLTIMGKTSCAACEHGVHPIGSPDQLGLAVTSTDGTIFVIEDAHQRWPGLYKDRFDGKSVKIDGTVIKRQGKFAWVRANDLQVL